MDAALRALAEPNRRRILTLVRAHEMAAGEIAAEFKVSRPAVSQHLAVLRNAGLLDERREGTRRFYRLRERGVEKLRADLEAFWDDRITALKRAVEEETP